MRLPQVREHSAVWHLPVPGHRDRDPLLDRLHELGAEPADLRVLQPRFPRSVQEHPAVRLLLALQTGAVRSRGAGLPPAIPQVRSGLTHRGTHSVLSLFFFSNLPVIVAPYRLLCPPPHDRSWDASAIDWLVSFTTMSRSVARECGMYV